jgi:predicted phosphodiesterase
MRVAVLYDIHGNLGALDSVLDEIGQSGVDQIIVGGDVLPGPQPRQTLERLLDLEMPVQFIHGNGDRVVLAQMRGGDISEAPESHQDVIRWTAQATSSV